MLRHALLSFILYTLTLVPAIAQTLPAGPQVLTFFSDIDDSEQPYAIYIPPGYSQDRAYPLVVMLHGAGSNHRLALRRVFGKSNEGDETDVEASRYFPKWKDVDMIVAAPFARGTAGYQGFAEKDVLDMLADIRSRFTIDDNRMYLTGLSMGGGGTLWIGLSRPDLWAAIAAVCPLPPNGTDALAGNAINMGVHLVHGTDDPVVPVSVSREWTEKFKALGKTVEYIELEGVQHESWVGAYENGRIFDWFRRFVRNPHPDHVRHATHDLAHGSAYWCRIIEKESGDVSQIDARFVNINTLEISTEHVLSFTLHLQGHPKYTAGSPLVLWIDGYEVRIESPGASVTVARSEHVRDGWIVPPFVTRVRQKRPGLEGPVRDAFATRHIYVYGTADNPSPAELNARRDLALKASEWSSYRGEFLGRIRFYPRVLADRELRTSDLESAHLILFGTKETNGVIAKYQSDLPLHLPADKTADHGLLYIYPNAYGRYMVVCSGLPWWRARESSGWRVLPEAQTPLYTFWDYILFKADKTILAEGYFDKGWTLQEHVPAWLRRS